MKKSVFLNDATVEAIESRQKPGEANYSGTINSLIDRYQALIRNTVQELDLSTKEWTTIFSIYNGTVTGHDAAGTVKMLLAEVMDSEEAANTPHLPEKIRSMNFCQRLAVIDMADRFWSRKWEDASDYDEIISILKE